MSEAPTSGRDGGIGWRPVPDEPGTWAWWDGKRCTDKVVLRDGRWEYWILTLVAHAPS
jgi:hypothetical protein